MGGGPIYICPAPYFVGCLSEEDLDELNIEIIRNTLYKAYLQDFYRYCQTLGGVTAEVMSQILQVLGFTHTHPPLRAFLIDLPASPSSFAVLVRGGSTGYQHHYQLLRDGTEERGKVGQHFPRLLPQPQSHHPLSRETLYPSFGMLFPEGTEKLTKADKVEQVRDIVDAYGVCLLSSLSPPT